GGKDRFGILHANGITDLSARTSYPTLRALIAANDQTALNMPAEADFREAEISYLIPVPDADKIICVGVNYANRNAEYKDGSDLPAYPSLFLRTRSSFTGHGQPLMLPPESPQFDYEGEIVLVIGKGGRRISQNE